MEWLINGSATAGISPDDRGFSYGDGLFETIAVREGTLRLFAEHSERMTASAIRLGLPPPDMRTVAAQAQRLTGSDQPDGSLKLIYTRGPGERGYAPPAAPRVTLAIGFEPGRRDLVGEAGVAVCTCRTPLARSPLLAGMKTLNRLEQVLARAEWQDSSMAEGLMFDTAGQLVCGTMSNIFVVRAGQLLTPLLDHCGVQGIMRQQVWAAAKRLGIAAIEARLTQAELQQADEVFVTNSQIGIWPVGSVDGRAYLGRRLTNRLRRELQRTGIAECPV